MNDPLDNDFARENWDKRKDVLNLQLRDAPKDVPAFIKLVNDAFQSVPAVYRRTAQISLSGEHAQIPGLHVFYYEDNEPAALMEFDEIAKRLEGIPHTTPEKGKVIYDIVREKRPARCLELGFASGVGSVYIASALEKNGEGQLTSVDTQEAYKRVPLASDTVERFALQHRVELVFHEISYTWFLMDALEKGMTFDFCFLDGAHTWDVDGLAFSLLERLMEPRGVIVFDDLDWCYATSPTMKNVQAPETMRTTAGVRKVFDLLVKPSPLFRNFHEVHGMGIAERK